MSTDVLLDELKQTFLDELSDILEYIEEAFIKLEKNHNDTNCINEIFRLFHNAKGSGKTVGLIELSHCAHAAENILSKIRSGELHPHPKIIDILIQTVDHMRLYQQQAKADVHTSTQNLTSQTQVLEQLLLAPPQDAPSEESQEETDDEEERPQFQQSQEDNLPPPDYIPPPVTASSQVDEFIKIPLKRIDELLDLFGEQVILQSSLDHSLEGDLAEQQDFIRKTALSLKKITQNLQHTMVSLRMVSIRPLFSRMERTIRDISKMTEKEINFVKKGETSELDKTIVDALIDPLTHMVRNAVDHGIESTDQRLTSGKDSMGMVSLTAQRNGGSFEIIVEDDGGGLDKETIFEKAKKLGLASGSISDLSDEKIFSFIFASGFSTREQATEISGRGVGMDVVNQKIISLKGSCKILSQKGKGTRFTIRLPLSLAMFNGTIVSIAGERYVVPNSDFSEAISIKQENFKEEENIVHLQDRIIRVIDLKNILETQNMNIPDLMKFSKKDRDLDKNKNTEVKKKIRKKSTKKLALISVYDQNEYAFLVNDIISQEQIVLKQLGPEFRQVQSSSGGTILGDGKVALVLDLNSVVKNNAK